MRLSLWFVLLAACGSNKPPEKPPVAVTAKPVDAGVPPGKPRLPMFGGDECQQTHSNPDSVKLFEKACAAQTGQGCEDLGMQYRCGVGVPQDIAQAFKYLIKACDLGDAHGCSRVAKLHMDSNDPAQGADAMKFADRGCKGGDAEACGYVGLFYWQGVGVPADPAHAAVLFDEQCQKQNMMSCANLAVELYMGQGVTRDLPRAKTLADASCKAGMQAACNILGGILVDEGGEANINAALALFKDLCEAGAAVSCDNLGQVFMLSPEKGGLGNHRDEAKAAFKKACDMGNGPGCTHLGEM